jgi:glycosyltransferase involved in cell wall biosynthesis
MAVISPGERRPGPGPAGHPAVAAREREPAAAAPFGIGLFTPEWPPGSSPNGVVNYVGMVAAQLHASGHPVAILAGEAGPGPPEFPVHEIRASRRGTVRDRLIESALYRLAPRLAVARVRRSVVRAAVRMIVERQVHILEMEESLGLAGLVQRAVRIPVVVRLHGPWFLNGTALGVPDDHDFRRRVEWERRAIELAAGVTSPSRDVLDRVRRHYGLALERAEVIPNPCPPVDPRERWRFEGCDPRRLLFIGRFDRHKGGDLVLEAFGRAWRAFPQARLTFVGPDRGFLDDGGRRWSLDEFVRERLPDAMAAGAVELLGQRPFSELGALRRRAIASIVCSRYENFPGTVMESLATGCPTIAADVGGIPEILEEGETGLLHRPGDPAHLAARMLELLREPARAARLGEAAARSSQRFHPSAIVPRILAHYSAVMRG